MYTNGYTGQQYRSIVDFIDASGATHAFMEQTFIAQSEQIELFTLSADAFQPETVVSYSLDAGYRAFAPL